VIIAPLVLLLAAQQPRGASTCACWPGRSGSTDVRRAGPRDHLSVARSLAGVGVGASFVDGLIRLDVTRAARVRTGWRIDFYTDAAL